MAMCFSARLVSNSTQTQTQTDEETNGQTPAIEFGAFSLKMRHLVAIFQ